MGPDSASWITIFLHYERIRTWSEGEEVRDIYDKSELGLIIWTILFSPAVVRESEVNKSLGNYIWYGGFWEDQWARAGLGSILLSYICRKNKVMDWWLLEEKPLKGQLTGSIKTKIPELVRRRQTLQREHFILKPKEVPVQSGLAKIPPTTPTPDLLPSSSPFPEEKECAISSALPAFQMDVASCPSQSLSAWVILALSSLNVNMHFLCWVHNLDLICMSTQRWQGGPTDLGQTWRNSPFPP